MIEFHCQHCFDLVSTPDETAGKKGRCPHCRKIMEIPTESQVSQAPARPPLPTKAVESLLNETTSPPAAEPRADDDAFSALDQPPQWGNSATATMDAHDANIASAAFRRVKESPERQAARARIKGPALGLFFISLLSILAIVAGVVVWMFMQTMTTGWTIAGESVTEIAVPMLFFLGGSFISLCMIMVGSVEMYKMDKWGMALLSAIFAILPCATGLLTIPFGIWAIVVLLKPEVKKAFRST